LADNPSIDIESFRSRFHRIVSNVETVIQGKRDAIELMVLAMVSEGHVLIEDVPGVGASPKTQSALLEAMEERQVTSDGVTRTLGPPFMVIATQNPLEHEGTYPLPEAQLDRFMMRVVIGYPSREKELEILNTHGIRSTFLDLDPVVSLGEVSEMVDIARQVSVSQSVKNYIVDLVEGTRLHPDLMLGASPRSALFLQRISRSRAAASGRDYVMPDDLKEVAGPVLEHRIALRPEAQMRGETITSVIADVMDRISVPGTTSRIAT
jgi:MoxR-like ATPase